MGIINCACTATFPENIFDWLVDGVTLYGGKILGRQKKGLCELIYAGSMEF